MANNTTLNPGVGGDTIASDDVAGVKYQRVKLVDGTEDSTTPTGTSANALRVDPTGTTTQPVSGSVAVSSLPALVAGTANIGDVDVLSLPALPAGTNNIGDVDVLSVIPGTAATNLGKAEDAAHTTGDTGVMALVVRSDAGGTLVSLDGDYSPLQVDAAGALRVTGGGGGTQYIEDTASAGGETMTLAGVVRQDTIASSTSLDGDYAYLKVTAAGRLYVDATLAAGTSNIGDVDVLSVVPGTGATSLGKAEDAAHTSGDVGVMALVVRSDAGGTLVSLDGDYSPLQVDAAGALRVTGGGGGTQYVEDTASAGGETMTLAGVVRQDAITTSTSADGDYAYLKVTAEGRLYTSANIDTPIAAGDNNIGNVDVASVVPGTTGAELGKAEDAAHASGDTGVFMLGVRNDSHATRTSTDGDYSPISVDLAGRINIGSLNTIANSIVPGTASNQLGKQEDAAHSSGDVGVMALAVRNDAETPLATNGNYIPITVDSANRIKISGPVPNIANGLSIHRVISAASTNGANIKGSAGNIYDIYVSNINASPRYVKFYNKATAPTVGTDTPLLTFLVAGNTAGAGATFSSTMGFSFSLGIGIAITTGVADADTGAVAANEIVVNLGYK
jgi:hypothetical protein